MKIMRAPRLPLLLVILLLASSINSYGQKDSTRRIRTFSGSIGFTNNGFSIIPSFSFNEPGALNQFAWKWNRFSVEPDFRVTPNAKKGSFLLWFRYKAIQGKKFSMRVGMHPAVNWMPATVIENGVSTSLLRMRRFLAWELAPSYAISKNWSMGIYYLQGNGLQKGGPQTTHFVTLNSTIANIPLTKSLRFTFSPAVFYLNVDKAEGTYFTATSSVGHKKLPFTLHSTINQTFRSSIPGNQNFMWNIGVSYHFNKTLR